MEVQETSGLPWPSMEEARAYYLARLDPRVVGELLDLLGTKVGLRQAVRLQAAVGPLREEPQWGFAGGALCAFICVGR